MSNCARNLNMPESAKTSKCGQICFNMSKVVNMDEYVRNITCLNRVGF